MPCMSAALNPILQPAADALISNRFAWLQEGAPFNAPDIVTVSPSTQQISSHVGIIIGLESMQGIVVVDVEVVVVEAIVV